MIGVVCGIYKDSIDRHIIKENNTDENLAYLINEQVLPSKNDSWKNNERNRSGAFEVMNEVITEM